MAELFSEPETMETIISVKQAASGSNDQRQQVQKHGG
jgi:hypothetical protein